MKELRAGDIRKIFPKRLDQSHKGNNGKVLIVGGSLEYYGAPLLSGLGALYGGADLVHIFVPEVNFQVSRSLYPDFIIHAFPGDHFDLKGAAQVLAFAPYCNAILVGPGLAKQDETFAAVLKMVQELAIPTILDADAIQVFQKITTVPLKQKVVITPHHGELSDLLSKEVKITTPITQKSTLLRTLATDLKITILLKGPHDLLASEKGEVVLNTTGNPGMTVGGSGDVLSGFVTSLIAQGCTPFDACQAAIYLFGKVGENLFKQKGYGYSASDLALELPYTVKDIIF